ncbi:hypothetical protein GCM10027614_22010 [Micromonospora vulcania]
MLTTKRTKPWRSPLLRGLSAAVAVLVALSLSAPPAFANSTSATPDGTGPLTASATDSTTGGWTGRIDWRACPERPDDPGTRCGTLRLPVDWARPNGATFQLALARRAATDPAARIGVLVINPGGPGLSGVDATLTADSAYGPDVLRRFDIVGFDPRGTVRSAPVRCSSALLAQQPSLIPASRAEYDRLLAYNRQMRDDCRAHSGPLFDHFDSASAARDMDAVRAALGERQLSFYGLSYGSLIGQNYAELFPDRVRAMVLDSAMDHSVGVREYFRSGAASNEALFNEFVRWCDRNQSCALHGRDVPAMFDRLMRRADAGTLVDAATGATLDWFELGFATFANFFDSTWTDLANTLVALERGEPANPPLASPGRPSTRARTSPSTRCSRSARTGPCRSTDSPSGTGICNCPAPRHPTCGPPRCPSDSPRSAWAGRRSTRNTDWRYGRTPHCWCSTVGTTRPPRTTGPARWRVSSAGAAPCSPTRERGTAATRGPSAPEAASSGTSSRGPYRRPARAARPPRPDAFAATPRRRR